jgi:hypothetical protein
MVPLWLAVKDSPLAMSILKGAMLCMDPNRFLLPEMWLEADESISQIILSSSREDGMVDPAESMIVSTGVISASEMLATMMMSSDGCSASQAALCMGFGGGGAVMWDANTLGLREIVGLVGSGFFIKGACPSSPLPIP